LEKIITEKIQLEGENSNLKGTELRQIFNKYGIKENKYIESIKEKFEFFKDIEKFKNKN
jgi:hypothetical protein